MKVSRRSRIHLLIGLAALVATAALPSHAGLVDYGTYLLDEDARIEWRDVTGTVGLSYNQVEDQLGEGGLFEGWRLATIEEFNQLVRSTGTPAIFSNSEQSVVYHPDGYIDNLIGLLGTTQVIQDFNTLIYGMLSTGSGSTMSAHIAKLLTWTNPTDPRSDESEARNRDVLQETAQDNVGSFLVRSTVSVPEPSSITLLGAGLLGLGIMRMTFSPKR